MKTSLLPFLLLLSACSPLAPGEEQAALMPRNPGPGGPGPGPGPAPDPNPPSDPVITKPDFAFTFVVKDCLTATQKQRLQDKVKGIIDGVGEKHLKAWFAQPTFDAACANGVESLGLWSHDPGAAARQAELALLAPTGHVFAFHVASFAIYGIVQTVFKDVAASLHQVSLNSYQLQLDGSANQVKLDAYGTATALNIGFTVDVTDQVDRLNIDQCVTSRSISPSLDLINGLITALVPYPYQVPSPDLSKALGVGCTILSALPRQVLLDTTLLAELHYSEMTVDAQGLTAAGELAMRAPNPQVTLYVQDVTVDDGPGLYATISAGATATEMLDPIMYSWTFDGQPATGNGRSFSKVVKKANVEGHVIGVTASNGTVSASATGGYGVYYVPAEPCLNDFGKPISCGCKPKTCAQLGANCGSVSDGCGHTLSCGGCTAPSSCGAVTANVCGCVPRTSCSGTCGNVDDTCGGVLVCPACPHKKDPACVNACADALDNCSGRTCAASYKACVNRC